MWIMLHNIHILSLVLHLLKTLCSKAACIAEYCTMPVRCHTIWCVVQSSVPVRDKAIPSIQRVKEIMVGHLHHHFFEEKKKTHSNCGFAEGLSSGFTPRNSLPSTDTCKLHSLEKERLLPPSTTNVLFHSCNVQSRLLIIPGPGEEMDGKNGGGGEPFFFSIPFLASPCYTIKKAQAVSAFGEHLFSKVFDNRSLLRSKPDRVQ